MVCMLLAVQASVSNSCRGGLEKGWRGQGGQVGQGVSRPLHRDPVWKKVASLGDFLLPHSGWFNSSALKLLMCQILYALCSLLVQMYAMDLVLGNEYLGLGNIPPLLGAHQPVPH